MSDSESNVNEQIKDQEVGETSDIPKPPTPPAPPQPVVDATAMKAFAHPLRMAMYDYLNDHGSATATMLAEHTGESTGQTSYHLRQLERHGFVTDDPTRGKGRERWWKAVGFTMKSLELSRDTATRPAVASMLRNQVAQHAATLSDWYDRAEQEDPEWAETSTNNRYTLSLTIEEALDMRTEVIEVLRKYAEITHERTEQGPEAEAGTRRVRVYIDMLPLAETE